MLLKNEPLENRQVLLTIRVDKEDWQRALQELYNDCSSLYPVEGCAPGKATREQLEAAYGKDFLYQDAVNHTFPEALVEAVAEANLQVAAAPDLSDETARRFGFENLAALRRAILEGAVRQKEVACRESFSDRLMAMVIAGMETEIPEVMVEGQLDGLMQELEQRLHQQGASLDDYLKAAGTTREALRDHAREQARHGVQVELALSEVARRENINITDEELEQEYGVRHLPSDFKKQNGYLRSLQLSEEYGLYRQDYCGCEFSAKARGIE